jgi:hypothetical protein
MSTKIKPEFMTDEQLRVDFHNRYSKRRMRDWLQRSISNYPGLVKRFILDKPKNVFYTPNDNSPITPKDNEYFALANWIIPTKSYIYREIDWDSYCQNTNVSRSGIIPIVKINGKNYWLLANFKDYQNTQDPILLEFGGRCEEKDKIGNCFSLKCAGRELDEESKGLLSGFVKTAINKGDVAILEGISRDGDVVHFLFVQLEYGDVKDLPQKFQTIESKENLGNLGFYSQKDVKSGKYRTSKNLTDLLLFLNKTRQ